ncbi:MAG: hypothetical protein KDA32_03260 [Phycisphaerales bacterium]|nr:hypothetical protein [Phycisphaerales bacterium]
MNFANELRRKSIHAASSVFPIAYWFIDKRTMLLILGPMLIVWLIIEALRHHSPTVGGLVKRYFGGLFRDFEDKALSGAAYVLIANVLTIALFPKEVAIPGLLMLSISDALASLVGMSVGGPRFLGKSWSGSAAFFVSAAAIALTTLPDHPIAGVIAAAVTTVVEALPLRWRHFRIDDNFSIPLSAGLSLIAAMRLFA